MVIAESKVFMFPTIKGQKIFGVAVSVRPDICQRIYITALFLVKNFMSFCIFKYYKSHCFTISPRQKFYTSAGPTDAAKYRLWWWWWSQCSRCRVLPSSMWGLRECSCRGGHRWFHWISPHLSWSYFSLPFLIIFLLICLDHIFRRNSFKYEDVCLYFTFHYFTAYTFCPFSMTFLDPEIVFCVCVHQTLLSEKNIANLMAVLNLTEIVKTSFNKRSLTTPQNPWH